jgi:hypothetical protein
MDNFVQIQLHARSIHNKMCSKSQILAEKYTLLTKLVSKYRCWLLKDPITKLYFLLQNL